MHFHFSGPQIVFMKHSVHLDIRIINRFLNV